LRGLAEHLLCIRERSAVVFRKLLGFGNPDFAPFKLVGILAFCQRHVVQVAGAVQDAVQVLFLCLAWIEAIFENANTRVRIAHALTPALSEGWWALTRRDQHLYYSTDVHPTQPPQIRLKPNSLSSTAVKTAWLSRGLKPTGKTSEIWCVLCGRNDMRYDFTSRNAIWKAYCQSQT